MSIDETLKDNLIADVENILDITLTPNEDESLARCFEITIGHHYANKSLQSSPLQESEQPEEMQSKLTARQFFLKEWNVDIPHLNYTLPSDVLFQWMQEYGDYCSKIQPFRTEQTDTKTINKMDDPRELERLRNYKPSLDDLKMHDKTAMEQLRKALNADWVDITESKPLVAKGFTSVSDKVEVLTPLGKGSGFYSHANDDWLIEIYGQVADELQSYKDVTHWRYLCDQPSEVEQPQRTAEENKWLHAKSNMDFLEILTKWADHYNVSFSGKETAVIESAMEEYKNQK